MRKKYLSALLFGALLVTSTGTFTSCKDYDDEINGLQEQITANADAIKKLQEMIGDGKFVTNVTSESNGLKITWNDGQSTVIENVINGEDQKGDVVTINKETGEIVINGEGTGFFATTGEEETPEEVKLPYVNEEGVLVLVDAEGKEVVTGIRVAPVTAVVNEDGSAEITIIGADGKSQTVKVPSAASSITSIVIADNAGNDVLLVYNQKFTFNGNDVISKASDWKGTKKLPSDDSYIISTDEIDVRINPVATDLSNVNFYLTNTKNKDVPSVVLTAKAESGDNPLTGSDINSRAANTGNGLWSLSMANTVISKDAFENANTGLSGLLNASAADGNVVYALNAAHACRSLYEIQLLKAAYTTFNALTYTQGGATLSNTTVKVGSPVTVGVNKQNSLYDMYLEADKSDVEVYGLTFDQANHTFTVGKNPDVSSVDASFTLNVYTVNVAGKVEKRTVTVKLDTQLNAATEYTTISHNVGVEAKKNYFGIDLSVMKEALGDNLNAWMQNVDLSTVEYKWSDDKNNINGNKPTGIEFDIVEKLKDIPSEGITGTTDRNKANFIQVSIDNDKSNGLLDLDKEFYIKITFKQKAPTGVTAGALNSIVVPVKFTAPAFADLFEKESAVFVNNGNVAHAYLNVADYRSYNGATYAFKNAFKKTPSDVTYSIPEEKFSDDYNYNDLATINVNAISLLNTDVNTTTGIPAGYKKEIKVIAKSGSVTVGDNTYYVYEDTRWIYAKDKEAYTFNVMIMSPIYEGVVSAVKDVVAIPATGSAYQLGNSDIQGTTYNAIKYNVLPDKVQTATNDNGESWYYINAWSRQEIKAVTVKSNNERVFEVSETPSYAYYEYVDNKQTLVEGKIAVTPKNIAATTESTMTVTVEDVWGYKKPNDIKVKITVGE